MSRKKQTKKAEEPVPETTSTETHALGSSGSSYTLSWRGVMNQVGDVEITESNGRKNPKLVLPKLTQCVHCCAVLSSPEVSKLHAYRCPKHPTSIAIEVALASDAKLIQVVMDGWEIQGGKFVPKGEASYEVAK